MSVTGIWTVAMRMQHAPTLLVSTFVPVMMATLEMDTSAQVIVTDCSLECKQSGTYIEYSFYRTN